MNITRNTPFRDVGPVPFSVWNNTVTKYGGRGVLGTEAAWKAAGTLSGVLLRILIQESSVDTDYKWNSKANNNPYNIRVKGYANEGTPAGYIAFPDLVAATKAAAERINGASGYFDGANPYASCITISDLLTTYAPPKWNDTEGLITKMVDQLNVWLPNWSPPVTTPSTPEEPIPGEQETPVTTYNYDNGVEPPWVDYPVADGKKYAGYIAAKDHFIAACVIHSAYGGLQGSTSWFQGGNALTDTMVGNSFDGGALDGQLRRFNDAYGGRYAWASGPVSSPIDDAAKFLEIFGPDKEVVNMYTTALERSCAANVATNAVTEKEHAARVAWVAYHANRYGKRVKEKTGKDGFTCDTFPLIPAENNRSFIIYHGEINADKRNTCPDPLVRQTIDRLIADVRTVLAGWQKGTTTIPPVTEEPMPTYAPAKPIAALQAYKDKDAAPAYVKVGSDLFTFVNDRVRAIKATPRYQGANTGGDKIGPDIEKGTEFAVLWLFWDEKGIPWYYTPYATRVLAADTQRIADAA